MAPLPSGFQYPWWEIWWFSFWASLVCFDLLLSCCFQAPVFHFWKFDYNVTCCGLWIHPSWNMLSILDVNMMYFIMFVFMHVIIYIWEVFSYYFKNIFSAIFPPFCFGPPQCLYLSIWLSATTSLWKIAAMSCEWHQDLWPPKRGIWSGARDEAWSLRTVCVAKFH